MSPEIPLLSEVDKMRLRLPELLRPVTIGNWALAHRIVMAPLGHFRPSQPAKSPALPSITDFYASRASRAGLLIAGGMAIAPDGMRDTAAPRMYASDHANTWRQVTDAVHRREGFIVAQLWHAGRLALSSVTGHSPVSASPIAARGTVYAPTPTGSITEVPQSLSDDGIDRIIDQYRQSAENAADAGFDGVELQCANGCLLDQFLHDGSNERRDGYGGSTENRVRLLIDVVQALTAVWGPNRVGVRLSPFGRINDVNDSDPIALFSHALERLEREEIAYVHLMEERAGAGVLDLADQMHHDIARTFRKSFGGILIASGGFDLVNANRSIADGSADAVAFGRPFMAEGHFPIVTTTAD